MSEKRIVVNQIETPDGTLLQSRSVHDFKGYTDKNGNYYAVDGGLEYLRRVFDKADFKERSLYEDSPHEEIRKYFRWGTYGPTGLDPLHYILLKDMSTAHVEAVVNNHTWNEEFDYIKQLFINELSWRNSNETD